MHWWRIALFWYVGCSPLVYASATVSNSCIWEDVFETRRQSCFSCKTVAVVWVSSGFCFSVLFGCMRMGSCLTAYLLIAFMSFALTFFFVFDFYLIFRFRRWYERTWWFHRGVAGSSRGESFPSLVLMRVHFQFMRVNVVVSERGPCGMRRFPSFIFTIPSRRGP